MKRVPLYLVIPLIPIVIGVTWWQGVKDIDFMAEPTAMEIETAKSRAVQEIARPSDLFAVEQSPEEVAKKRPIKKHVVKDTPKVPRIEAGLLDGNAPLDEWSLLEGFPAASFVDLASRLESEGQLSWSRVAWERVLDHVPASDQERGIAIKAVRRIRESFPEVDQPADGALKLSIQITAPKDRIKLTTSAAADAKKQMLTATDGLILIEPKVSSSSSNQLSVQLGVYKSAPSEAPAGKEAISEEILKGIFSAISTLTKESSDFQPIQAKAADTPVNEALATHISRQAWLNIVQKLNSAP